MTEPNLVCPCGTPHGHTPSLLITNPSAWQDRVRPNILNRDAETCRVCGAPAPIRGRAGVRSGHCGHVLARELGGCDNPRNLRAECASCSTTDGARIGNAQRRATKIASAIKSGVETRPGPIFSGGATQHDPASVLLSPPEVTVGDELVGPGPEDSVWDGAPWLDELREVPADATWPRLMTAPHPRAVGSFGGVFVAWAEARNGRPLHWWQRLVAFRLLEHDEAGRLVWWTLILTLARQLGKSYLLRELLLWRTLQAERFGEEQLVLHTGKDMGICHEVQRPALAWGEVNGLFVRRANGEVTLSTADNAGGSRWVVKSKDGVYGYSATTGAVDEAWKVRAAIVDEGIEPTMVEHTDPQLLLVSTAHRLATGLMLERRKAAAAELLAPDDTLLVDWSSPEHLELGDEAGWRMASPRWTERRRKLVARAYEKAMRGESDDPEEPDPVAAFTAQWLNRWPQRLVLPAKVAGERLLPEQAWSALVHEEAAPVGPLQIGVEDNLGRGAAAACAGVTADGLVVVGGWEFPSRAEAFQWARGWHEAVPGSRLVVGASLENDLEVQELAIPVDTAGRVETPGTLALFRTLVAAGAIVHDGGDDLARHVDSARVRANTDASALQLVSTDRSDLLRVASWVAARADRDRGARVAIH